PCDLVTEWFYIFYRKTKGEWEIACWPPASIGQLVTIPCPNYFSHISDQKGNISKSCTEDGWTNIDPAVVAQNCGYTLNYTEGEDMVRITWTTIVEVNIWLELHFTGNFLMTFSVYKHAMSRPLLYTQGQEVGKQSSLRGLYLFQVGCKAAVVFFQYGIMASFFWLLVEGLYLHALLAVSFFSHRKYFWWYILIGWGKCWDFIDDNLWWIIRTPIVIIILMNFILFVCIIRILRQKINCRDIGRNESNQYSRLAKSTLLLIPLFGINYFIFAFMPRHVQSYVRLVFDLVLGSFQGFCVAVLYCFLNGEVQSEIKRKWRRWHMQRFLGAGTKYQQPCLASNGNHSSTQITMLTKCSPSTRRASACQDDFSNI
uniref:Vasoactive intestinal peptide receptor 1a n=1 Tax=Astyanax mexicanus TaxID=7994 RepID=A0A8B9GN60_ASTMX